MRILAAWIALSIPTSGAPPTLEVGGAIGITVPLPHPVGGAAIGPLVLEHPDTRVRDLAVKHELGHVRQFEALGPGFPIAYALSAGAAFEHYRNSDGWEWHPEPDAPRCPLLRLEGGTWSGFPCWRF